jgi:glyoxylase-like metal-dependent hydrolase (beta-lactamase superfamily II)
MHEIAPDVFHLPVVPRNGVNTYLVGDVLVDTGLRTSAKKIMGELKGRELKAIALTHAHGDHGGSARKLAAELGLPVWVGAADREAAETGKIVKRASLERPGISIVARLMATSRACPSRATCTRETSWRRASPCSTRLATRPVTSRTGARAIAC